MDEWMKAETRCWDQSSVATGLLLLLLAAAAERQAMTPRSRRRNRPQRPPNGRRISLLGAPA